MKAVILLLLFSLSFQSFARPTPEAPNARTVLRNKMKQLKREALKVSFIPILNLISIPRWKKYNHCKQVYFYFKSAYILSHKNDHKKIEIRTAKRRLMALLKQLKQETNKIKDLRVYTLDSKDSAQKILNTKIEKMNLRGLVKILESGDRVVPGVLISPESLELKYDADIFRETLIRVADDSNLYPKTIFEASVIREQIEIRKNPVF